MAIAEAPTRVSVKGKPGTVASADVFEPDIPLYRVTGTPPETNGNQPYFPPYSTIYLKSQFVYEEIPYDKEVVLKPLIPLQPTDGNGPRFPMSPEGELEPTNGDYPYFPLPSQKKK